MDEFEKALEKEIELQRFSVMFKVSTYNKEWGVKIAEHFARWAREWTLLTDTFPLNQEVAKLRSENKDLRTQLSYIEQHIITGDGLKYLQGIESSNQRLREALEKVDGHTLLADHSKKQYVWVCDIRQTCREALAETEGK